MHRIGVDVGGLNHLAMLAGSPVADIRGQGRIQMLSS